MLNIETFRLIYEGTWKSGLRHGFGIQMWPDGSVYEGEWNNDQAHGYGRLVGKNGEMFILLTIFYSYEG